MSAVLVFWPSRPPYQEGSLLLGPSVFGVLVVLSFRWTSFLSGVKSTAMLYLFGSFSVLSDESTIYKYRGGISLSCQNLSRFVVLAQSACRPFLARLPPWCSCTRLCPQFESLQLQILLSSLNILKRHDYFSLSLEGRWHIRNIRPQTNIVAGLKVSFFCSLWVTSEFVHTWVSIGFKFCVG